jgi:alcohol dehydrogenase class IV
VVVSIGGGSVLDAGKAISAMYKQEGSATDFLEGVGTKRPTSKKVPFIAVPTTSGTGSEATKNAVITRIGPEGFKKSLRHDHYVPDLAMVDPELTLNCSPEQTARSGMDAFTQLLESYLSLKATPLTDALAIDALRILRDSLPEAVLHGSESLDSRSGMSYAALVSGITLANAGLGVVHGFASSIGGYFDIPHGLVCGTLMGVANKVTLRKLLKTHNNPLALDKYARVGKIFTGKSGKSDIYYAEALINLIDAWTGRFGLQKLSAYGVGSNDLRKIAETTSNKNNPVRLTLEEMEEILESRL